MQEIVICKRCGSVGDYHIEIKSNNHCAYCNSCGGYIKNIPHAEPKMYFGKYSGIKIKDISDADYLKWVLSLNKVSGHIEKAIQEKIHQLKNPS